MEVIKINKKRGQPKKKPFQFTKFAVRFRELISEHNYSLPEIADKVGATRQSIGNWKDGRALPNIEILSRLAECFDVSADYLLGLTDARTTDKDMQYICDYTGLDIETIKILRSIQCDDIPGKAFVKSIEAAIRKWGDEYE